MKNITSVKLLIISLFGGSLIMINDSPLHHQKATHLKDYFPKHFYREDKPRLLPIKELTKEEKIKVTNYLKSITETIEISSMSRD